MGVFELASQFKDPWTQAGTKQTFSGINVDSSKERDVFFPWHLLGKDDVSPELPLSEARILPFKGDLGENRASKWKDSEI